MATTTAGAVIRTALACATEGGGREGGRQGVREGGKHDRPELQVVSAWLKSK